MLVTIFGSSNRERVLLFLHCREEGYAREIARFFKTDLSQTQKQLERLETGGVLYSKAAGKTRIYLYNPRFPFLKELKWMLEKMMIFLPEKEAENLRVIRKRPGYQEKTL